MASVAHVLPPLQDLEQDATMTEFDIERASQRLVRERREEAEDDEEMRDIVWPVEKVFPVYTCATG